MPSLHRPRRVLLALIGLAAVGFGLSLHVTAKAREASTTATAAGPAIAYIPLPVTESSKLISIDISTRTQPTPQPASTSTATAPERVPVVIDQSGPVQTSPRIYVVFVGDYWQDGAGTEAATSMSQTLNFYRHVGSSQYDRVLAQYRGAGANAQLVAAWIDADTEATANADPMATLPFVINAARIPTGTQTQVDLIYPPGFTFTAASESGAVGYHSWADGVTFAAVSSVPGYSGSLTVTASHEYDETVSDPISDADPNAGLANHAFGFAASTHSRTILEVADVCQDLDPVHSHGVALARIYDAQTASCVAPGLDPAQ
jgi:hypothetical protein